MSDEHEMSAVEMALMNAFSDWDRLGDDPADDLMKSVLRELHAEGYTIAALPKNLACEQKDVIKRAIQSARINGQRARIEGEYLDIIGCRILEDLHAAGYEIVPRKCNHSGYRGWEIDGRSCPDCGNIVVDPGD